MSPKTVFLRSTPAILFCLFVSSCVALPTLPQRGETELTAIERTKPEAAGEMRIYIPDVGQGDATLILSPEGKSLLIDAGPPSAGKGALLPLLRELKIDRLDALIVTHYDLDHLGGVPSLLAGEDGALGTEDDIGLGVAYDRGGTPWDSSPGMSGYLSALEQGKIPRRTLEAGETLPYGSALQITVLATNGAVSTGNGAVAQVDLSPATYSGKENAASIAVLIEFGDFRYLTAGDLTGGGMTDGFLTPDVETLVAEAAGAVDVLHVNHHGSLSSSNPYFVSTTAPKAVVIQAGRDNPYGHPNRQVLERWRGVGAEVWTTVEEGGLILETFGESFKIRPSGS